MKTLSPIPALGLLLLMALMFTDAGSLEAKDKANDQRLHQGTMNRNDPPDHAPAHGYRRKSKDDDNCHKNKKHKRNDKSHRDDDDLERREAELERREAALRRKEANGTRDRGTLAKRRPANEAKKRTTSETTADKNERIYKSPKTKVEEILERKKQEERRQQEEVKSKIPGKQEGDWTGGSGW